MKKKPELIDDDRLVAMIIAEVDKVSTESFSTISQQRIESNRSFQNQYTNRTQPRNADNMSKIKMYFTPQVVSTLTMQMSKIFCSDKKTAEFNPSSDNAEAKKACDQLSEIVNSVIHKENKGYELITEMFSSAAVNKNSIAKVTWGEETEVIGESSFPRMSDEMAVQLIANKEEQNINLDDYKFEIVDKTNKIEEIETTIVIDEEIGEEVEETTTSVTYDYEFRESYKRGYIEIMVIPPEEFVINEETTSINNDSLTRFVAHRKRMYRSEVAEMFPDIDVDDLASSDDTINDEFEKRARSAFDDTGTNFGEGPSTGPESKVLVTESWIKADVDRDGYSEWRHCFNCGAQILSNEEWFGPLPFTSFTFFPVPHKFYGLSVYDRVSSYEEAATGLMRSEMDFARLKNTFRLFAKEGTVDKRSLQSGRPGVIDVSKKFDPTDVMPVPSPQGASSILQNIAELRKQVIGDVGIDPISGQVSSDIEQSGNDATKTAMAIENASVKMEGYARSFAEGPLRDISWLVTTLLVKNKDSKFVKDLLQSITPDMPELLVANMGLRNVINKNDITAKVGLGHQSAQQKIAATNAILPLLQQLEANPTQATYNLISNTLMGFGYETPEAIIGPIEFYQKKAEETGAQKQAMMQQQQAQTQQIQQTIQIEQQKWMLEQQLMKAESQAKIELDKAKALEVTAKAGKVTEETKVIDQPAAEVKVIV